MAAGGEKIKGMNKIGKRILAGLLCLLCIMPVTAGAEETKEDWPGLNEEGYLDSGEYILEDPDAGIWRYCSETLRIEVIRKTETKPDKMVWYEAEVWSRKEIFGFVTNEPGKHFSNADWPTKVCSKNGAVLAINADYASNRWNNTHYPKQRYKVGILLRDGEIMSTETKPSGNTSFPNLDTLATYPDGHLEIYDSKELTAEEYKEKGAVDVLAFGPWLIRDGEIRSNLKRYATNNRNPRTALGMIEPGHFIAVMVEGRHKKSKGCTLVQLADIMKEKGCVQAMNLDGGETSCILFMGKQICKVGNASSKMGYARKEPEFLAIGTSEQVEGYDPSTKK